MSSWCGCWPLTTRAYAANAACLQMVTFVDGAIAMLRRDAVFAGSAEAIEKP